MTRRLCLTVALATLCAAVPATASAKSTLTIRGAGWGHGIGMSQYGAYGMAQHGWTHEQILRHFYTGTRIGHISSDTVVRVLLQSAGTVRFDGATAAGGRRLNPDKTYGARAAGSRVRLLSPRGRAMGTFDAPLRVTRGADGPVRLLGGAANGVTDGTYRGWLELRPSGGSVLAINALGIEQYLAGVVPAESPASWPLEALEAQAIAARAYAVSTAKGGAFDQYADTRSQMYRGVTGETARTNQAVNATLGEVVTYDGAPITAYFFSTSGGRTENIEDAWPGSAPRPYLRSVDDPYDSTSPYHRWGPIRLTRAQVQAKLGSYVKGRFKRIDVLERGGSPRIVRAAVVGTGGRTVVTGPQLRTRFGLRDTWMTFNAISADVKGYDDGSRDDRNPPSEPAPALKAPSLLDTKGGGATAAFARSPLVHGTARPGRPGTPVTLQKRLGGTWTTVGRGTVGAHHRYRLALPGRGTYRVLVGRDVGPTVHA